MADRVPQGTGARVLLGGGIGAGKSTVAALMGSADFRVVNADAVGREVLAPGTEATTLVGEMWPTVLVDGSIDRRELARIVFSDAFELRRLEAVTHPEIVRRIHEIVEQCGQEDLVVETPLPGLLAQDDFVNVVVVADRDTRLERAVLRGNDAADTQRRMRAQPSDLEWREWADHVIDNSGTTEATKTAVADLVELVRRRG
ncbi:MAG: dephospho-CoA kinase [Acidimicrobiia bacterium]